MDVSMQGMAPQRTAQQTLAASIGCVGIGLHSGAACQLTLAPAPAGTGIVFRRIDLSAQGISARDIPARFDHVADTRLCTVLACPDAPEHRVGTVEHLMAALSARGIDNALVLLDGPEVPILEGSSSSFMFLLDCAGIATQQAAPAEIEVLRPVRVDDGPASAELRPGPGLHLAVSIDFAAPAIGQQSLRLRLTERSFRTELARARTFAMAEEVERLRSAGLARGGSLANAIVVDGARVLNPGGLLMPDEFVRHKALDVVGDLALAGAPLRGRYVGHRPGHALNNRLLRTLFADRRNWRRVDTEETVSLPLPRPRPEPQRIAA